MGRVLPFERCRSAYAALLGSENSSLCGLETGDVTGAVGAYNGGPGNPNLQYAAGVAVAANHARKMIEHAGALDGRPVAEIRFITSPRR